MFAVSLFYALTGEIFYTAIFLSLAVSLAAALVLAFRLSASHRAAVFGIVLLTGSKAFVDYSTSGLENPLTHLLLALFLAFYLRRHAADPPTLFRLFLIAALATVNRMDALLLFLPVLAYLLWRQRTVKALAALVAGFAPFLLWELFSLVYYGFLAPNTAYAKLNTGIPAGELAMQGLHYLSNSLSLDPLTLSVVALGLLTPLAKKEWRLLPVAAGMLLYLAYVVRIGGDFMSGRFLTPPFFAAVALLVHSYSFASPVSWSAALGAALLAGLLPARSPLRSGADYGSRIDQATTARNISDERALYYRHAGLLPALQKGTGPFPDNEWANRGRKLRQWAAVSPEKRVGQRHPDGYWIAPMEFTEGYLAASTTCDNRVISTWRNVGYSSFYAGPQVHIVDALALAEPLLARLPAYAVEELGPGHFGRLLPRGYLATHVEGRNLIADRNLATFYDKLRTIVCDDLFTRQRWREIWKMNTGQYAALIDFAYYQRPPELEKRRVETLIKPGDPTKQIYLGEELLRQGRMADAREAFALAFEMNPGSIDNRMIVADILAKNGHPELAATTLRQGLEIHPENYRLLVNLSAVLLKLDRLDQVRELCRQAIAIAPNTHHAYQILGLAEQRAGHPDRAIQAFRRLVELDSRNFEMHWALLRLLHEQNQRDEFAALAARVIDLDFPEADSEFFSWLGLFLLRTNRHELAIAACRRALERDSAHVVARVNLGWALYVMGQVDEAIQEFQKALDIQPSSAAQFNLGLALLARGDSEDAQEAYARGVRQFGADEAVRIGAVGDLKELISRGVQVEEARRILEIYWSE